MGNPLGMKKMQAIAKQLKTQDPTLKHKDAVRKAWAQMKAEKPK